MSVVPLVHADVVITFAEHSVSVIRGASLYRTGAGVKLRDDDIIETDAGQSAQLEDSAGTLIALGPHTQVLLAAPLLQQRAVVGSVRIAMLYGWLKVSCTSSIVRRPTLSIELHGLTFEPAGDGAWSVVAMANAQRIGVFAETGNGTLAARVTVREAKQPLRAGQYLERNTDGLLRVQSRPSAEFVGAMPPAFRDALVGLSDRQGSWHELPAPLRAVDYADISDWLASDVSMRGTFVKRFASRLKSASFRADIDAHLSVLPEWRPLLHPAPRVSTASRKRHTQALHGAGSERGANTDDEDETTPGDVDAH
jgi:hypothetical protein